jgi:hypothetical protein
MGFTFEKTGLGHRCSLSIAGLLLSIILLSNWAFGGWTHPSSWNRLKKNMSSDEVKKLLGTPKDKEETSLRSVWYYQQTPVRQDGKVTSRPKLGYVNFSKLSISPITRQRLSEPGLFISTWSVPDWTAITEEEKKADIPEEDLTMSEFPNEFEQRRPRMSIEHEERMRQMEERRKQMDAEFEKNRQEAMERMQNHQTEIQQRRQDVNLPARQIPRRLTPPPARYAPDTITTSPQPSVQPQSSQSETIIKAAAIAGVVVGIVFGIVVTISIFPLLMMLLVRWIGGFKVSWWMCCKLYVVAHIVGLIVVKGSDRIMRKVQPDGTGLVIVSIVSIIAALLIYASIYGGGIRDQKDNPLGFLKGLLLTLIVDALPLLILVLAFKK